MAIYYQSSELNFFKIQIIKFSMKFCLFVGWHYTMMMCVCDVIHIKLKKTSQKKLIINPVNSD